MPAIETSDEPQTNSTDRIDAGPDRRHRRAVGRADLGQRREPGRPPSREKAKIMREAEVTVARPQSNCDDEDRRGRANFLMPGGTCWSMAQKNTFQPCLAASSMFGIISTKAHRNR